MLSDRYFRGSGTSEAAAITSGSIALILQKYPNLTPDQVKRFIADNGQKVPGADSQAQGGGEITLATLLTKTPQNYTQKFANSTGTGSIEAARGTDHLTADGVTLTGEQDIFGNPSTPVRGQRGSGRTYVVRAATGTARTWSGSSSSGPPGQARLVGFVLVAGRHWSGSSWSGSSPGRAPHGPGRTWSGRSWSSEIWS